MPAWRRIAVGVGSAVAGAALGYIAERALIRTAEPVLRVTRPLGQLEGNRRVLHGPDGVRLLVETYGPPDDQASVPEVLLVHGFSLTGRIWHEQVLALRGRLRLVTYDQPGHGRCSRPRSAAFSLDLLADALAAVVEEATESRRGKLVLVGHSMGGMTALAFARRHSELVRRRVGAMLLLSTTAKSGAEDVAVGVGIQILARVQRGLHRGAGLIGRERLARVYRSSSDLSSALTRAIALARDADPRYVELTEQLVLGTDPETMAALSPVLLSMDEEETLATIDVPTIIVGGCDDRITPITHARWMVRVNPEVELIELPGVGHMTPLEAHDIVNALILRLVDAVRRDTIETPDDLAAESWAGQPLT